MGFEPTTFGITIRQPLVLTLLQANHLRQATRQLAPMLAPVSLKTLTTHNPS